MAANKLSVSQYPIEIVKYILVYKISLKYNGGNYQYRGIKGKGISMPSDETMFYPF